MSSTIPARIAFTEFLLSECVIVANRTALRLVELEIYHYNNADHSDPFAHCDELQSRWGRFYFHKMGGAYKGGTYKGLDITFGGLDRHREGSDTSDGGLVEYGGILVRAIQVASSGEVVEGPSLTVDKILSLTKKTAVKDLTEVLGGDEAPAWYPQNVWDGVAERFKMRAPQPIPYHACPPLLYLTTVEEAKKIGVLKDERWSVDIVRGPRVGLNLPAMSRIVGDPEAGGKKRKTIADSHEKNATPDDYCSYIGRPYRLISQAAKIKKGRQLIAVGMHIFHDAKPFQIEQKTGMKSATITGYLDSFAEGMKETTDKYFGFKCAQPADNAKCLGAAYAKTRFEDVSKPDRSKVAKTDDGSGPSAPSASK